MNKENYHSINKSPTNDYQSSRFNQNKKELHSSLSVSARKEYHDHYMRYLISSNAEYFQNKVNITPNAKSKDLKFKIPCRTGMTIYKKDYKYKSSKYNKEQGIKHNMSIDCIKTNNFFKEEPIDLRINDKTNYQKDFKYHQIKTQCVKKLTKRLQTTQSSNDHPPRFLETQNKIDFLNWAGKNYVPSMKPMQKSAVTNLPFGAKTIYNSDFESKVFTSTPIFMKGQSFPNFGNVSMIMKSNYTKQFTVKRASGIEISCKPKHMAVNICNKFKGTTQYKRQFIESKKEREELQEEPKSLQNLQTLIIDL